MEDFEPTIEQINDDIKPAWEDIKYLSEKLVKKLNCPRSFIGGMLNAIASDFSENISIKNTNLLEK
tara:strand:+ start:1081 stop:1278 length:198 start_codon:yes stop_codon:yes gene_type:complete